MKNYRPKSWSAQAREMCDRQVEYINYGHCFIEDSMRIFRNSYRHPLIVGRAAKRFGRMLKAGKIRENKEAYIRQYPLDAKDRGLI